MASELNLKAIDLGQTASTSDVIYDALRDAIIRGEMQEGETIRQESVAKLFNVSRIPVREALKRLEAQGLVTSVRYKGVVVSSISPREIEEIFEFRVLVESKLIEYAVESMTEQSLELAKSYCDAFAKETNPEKWGDLNRLFHSALYQDSGRPYYLEVIRGTNDRVERYVRAQLDLTEGMTRARRDHEIILDACFKRDVRRAADLTADHIHSAGQALIRFLQDRSR
ncbi:GntR family transcriptional regulator [Pelagibius sp. Alg239-R121]|uniref:GntR family transcriptional regulator n=1 Tax=Pelagibius sp. Alg239-R121 TaxID=2993448 RepID=UPI0024A70727|nr:GntR family transcriptional regulator [Pelagibius sp. Alg239-R121]